MANFDSISLELQKLAGNMKLTIGNAVEIRLEIWRITNAQKKLEKIKQIIAEAIKFEKDKSEIFEVLSESKILADSIPGAFLVDLLTSRDVGLVASQLSSPEQEAFLKDLQQGIDNLITWGDRLKQLAGDILMNVELLEHLKCQRQLQRLDKQVSSISSILKCDLAVNNTQLLNKQLAKITATQEQLTKTHERLDEVVKTINSSTDFIDTIKGLISFLGKSVFAVEWLDENGEAFIDDADQTKSVKNILEECIYLRQITEDLIIQLSSLRVSAERPLNQKQKPNRAVIRHPIVFIACILVVMGAVSWMTWPIFSQEQQIRVSSNDEIAVANLKSAQALGMSAAKIVQNPPHPITIWQQSQAKWQKAINLLEAIPEGTSVSLLAQKQLTTYRQNYAVITKRIITEQKASSDLESAQKLATEAAILVQKPYSVGVWQQARLKWQKAIHLMAVIPEGTFVSAQAKQKLTTYQTNYATVNVRLVEGS